MNTNSILRVLSLTFALGLAGELGAADPARGAGGDRSLPNWVEAGNEAVRNLTGMIRIDTSSGNETQVAQYLKAILDKEGIGSEILELQAGRGNLVARLRGNGTKRPVLLMGHTDVVGVERDKWSVIQETTRVHGNDERISVEGLRVFVEFVYDAVTTVAAANRPGPPPGPR